MAGVLMLLPAPLYFTSNRFDIVASFFVLLAFWYLQKGRDVATGVFLGVAALTKWTPLFCCPCVFRMCTDAIDDSAGRW